MIFNFQFSFNFQFFKKIKYIFNFYKHIWQERKKYDTVFVHMNPEYVVLGGLFWRLTGKKIGLWYTHKTIDLKLRLAERLSHIIFTASPESFRLPSKKVKIVGHGIDINKFKVQSAKFKVNDNYPLSNFKIITVGRIAPIKNLRALVEAAEILKSKGFDFKIKIAGAPIFKRDETYFEELKNIIKEKKLEKKIVFVGSVPHKNIAEFYREGDLFVNFSDTGSIDKAMLEAMAAGLPVLTSNEAFRGVLPEKYLVEKNADKIAEKTVALAGAPRSGELREYVARNHGLENLIKKIKLIYET